MDNLKKKIYARLKRKRRVRSKIHSTSDRPRITVFRSNRHIYAQIINDEKGVTIVSASTIMPILKTELDKTSNKHAAQAVGKVLAKLALEQGIKQVIFDRNGYAYHGRVGALAASAREHGLEF